MAELKKIPIVYIQWVDAHSNTGWFDDKDIDEWAVDDWYCDDVGYLIKETKQYFVFAQRHEPVGHGAANNEGEQWGALHKIPKTWVKNKKILGYINEKGDYSNK